MDVDCYVYVFWGLESQIIDNDMDIEHNETEHKSLMLQPDEMKQTKLNIRRSVHNSYLDLDLYIYNNLQLLETKLTNT